LAIFHLEEKIKTKLREEAERRQSVSPTRYDVEGETLRTSSWTKSAKGDHTKESIYEFKVQDNQHSSSPRYETRPKIMAEMARDYHDSNQERDHLDEYGRSMAAEIVLEKCNVNLSENDFNGMNKSLATTLESANALK
jgi:hypothetical protein